jgi:hypothetical protein
LQEGCQQAQGALGPDWRRREPVKCSVRTDFNRRKGTDRNLANVDVCAVRVDLGIVLVKDGGVGLEVGRNLFAGIVLNDDIGCRAILASVPEAESGSWYEVGAGWVDRARVNGGKLVASFVKLRKGRK